MSVIISVFLQELSLTFWHLPTILILQLLQLKKAKLIRRLTVFSSGSSKWRVSSVQFSTTHTLPFIFLTGAAGAFFAGAAYLAGAVYAGAGAVLTSSLAAVGACAGADDPVN